MKATAPQVSVLRVISDDPLLTSFLRIHRADRDSRGRVRDGRRSRQTIDCQTDILLRKHGRQIDCESALPRRNSTRAEEVRQRTE